MATINGSTFAASYLLAAETLMDALSAPNAQRFLLARQHAAQAKAGAYGTTETRLASHLLADVMSAAHAMGYNGYGE